MSRPRDAKLPLSIRFWTRVDKEGPTLRPDLGRCWVWIGRLKAGYGCFTHNRKDRRAHVYSYQIHKGVIPVGQCLLHKCDNPSCVNPDHLIAGSQIENRADCVAKGRQAKGQTIRTTKLTPKDIVEIRKRYRKSCTQNGSSAIARDYRVRQCTIYDIISGKTWRHIL